MDSKKAVNKELVQLAAWAKQYKREVFEIPGGWVAGEHSRMFATSLLDGRPVFLCVWPPYFEVVREAVEIANKGNDPDKVWAVFIELTRRHGRETPEDAVLHPIQ